ncbi:MAG: GDP-mannose-dependent alpha-mannosyltransferase [Rhodocyclaceae bacterium]|nr:GDP-mannose-dependent alpha-mannosyltransferase [Rhodocyclaceae bacterium]
MAGTVPAMSDLLCEELPDLRERLRVAVVTETYPPEINGVAMTAGRFVVGLQDRGHHVQLIRPRQRRDETGQFASGFSEVLAQGLPIPKYPHLRMGLPFKQALLRLWSQRRPDVVQLVTEGPLGYSALAAARQLKLPVVSDFHTLFQEYSRHYGIGWLQRPIAAYLRKFHNATHATLVPTPTLQAHLAERGYRNVRLVARGIDLERFHPDRRSNALRQSWGLGEQDLAVVFVSRIAPEKNLELLVRAFGALAEQALRARLVLVGDGPALRSMKTQHPEHVYAGMRTGLDLAAHYASGDLFLFPSITETYGNVVPEALASGLPVVAYDYAAPAQLVRPGENGFLARVGDARGLIGMAVRAVTDRARLQAMRSAARASVLHLGWERVIDQLLAVFNEVILAVDTEYRAKAPVPAEI